MIHYDTYREKMWAARRLERELPVFIGNCIGLAVMILIIIG